MGRANSVLIDTHIFLWILGGSKRLKGIDWLGEFPFWTLSPVSLLEIKFLQEIGRLSIDLPSILHKLKRDERFRIDDVPSEDLFLAAIPLTWTRDPFDRLLVAHSIVRSIPLGTCDSLIREKHSLVL